MYGGGDSAAAVDEVIAGLALTGKSDLEKKFDSVKADASKKFESVKSDASKKFNEAKDTVNKQIDKYEKNKQFEKTKKETLGTKSEAEKKIDAVKKDVSNKLDEVKDVASKKFDEAKDIASKKASEVKDAASENIEKAKDFVSKYMNDKPDGIGASNAIAKTAQVKGLAEEVRSEAEAKTLPNKQQMIDAARKGAEEEKKSVPNSMDDLAKVTEPTLDEDGNEIPNGELAKPSTGELGEDYSFTSYAIAKDLRDRGYDVEAMPGTEEANLDEVATWYKDAKPFSISDMNKLFEEKLSGKHPADQMAEMPKVIEKQMLSEGEGARGCFALSVEGESLNIAWENKGGKTVLNLGGTETDMESLMGMLFTEAMLGNTELLEAIDGISYLRTDNLEPSDKILKQVKNKKK